MAEVPSQVNNNVKASTLRDPRDSHREAAQLATGAAKACNAIGPRSIQPYKRRRFVPFGFGAPPRSPLVMGRAVNGINNLLGEEGQPCEFPH